MVFDNFLRKIADKSTAKFAFDGDDLPMWLRKSINFLLYKVFNVVVSIAFFAGTFVGMLYVEHKWGINRVIIFVCAVWVWRNFASKAVKKD